MPVNKPWIKNVSITNPPKNVLLDVLWFAPTGILGWTKGQAWLNNDNEWISVHIVGIAPVMGGIGPNHSVIAPEYYRFQEDSLPTPIVLPKLT